MNKRKEMYGKSKSVKHRYGLRKLSIGVASVLLGFTMIFGANMSIGKMINPTTAVFAAEVANPVQFTEDGYRMGVPDSGANVPVLYDDIKSQGKTKIDFVKHEVVGDEIHWEIKFNAAPTNNMRSSRDVPVGYTSKPQLYLIFDEAAQIKDGVVNIFDDQNQPAGVITTGAAGSYSGPQIIKGQMKYGTDKNTITKNWPQFESFGSPQEKMRKEIVDDMGSYIYFQPTSEYSAKPFTVKFTTNKFSGMVTGFYSSYDYSIQNQMVISRTNILVDTDGDGLSDDYETTIGSNPNNPDTDGDGKADGTKDVPGLNGHEIEREGWVEQSVGSGKMYKRPGTDPRVAPPTKPLKRPEYRKGDVIKGKTHPYKTVAINVDDAPWAIAETIADKDGNYTLVIGQKLSRRSDKPSIYGNDIDYADAQARTPKTYTMKDSELPTKEAIEKANPRLAIWSDGSGGETDPLFSLAEEASLIGTDAQYYDSLLKSPAKVLVKDDKNLTTDEVNAIKKAVKDANKEIPVKDVTVVETGEEAGKATVLYNDNTTSTKPFAKDKTVVKFVKPALTTVKNKSQLSPDDITAVKTAIMKANENSLGETPLTEKMITVAANGGTTIVYPGSPTLTLAQDETVQEEKIEVLEPTIKQKDNSIDFEITFKDIQKYYDHKDKLNVEIYTKGDGGKDVLLTTLSDMTGQGETKVDALGQYKVSSRDGGTYTITPLNEKNINLFDEKDAANHPYIGKKIIVKVKNTADDTELQSVASTGVYNNQAHEFFERVKNTRQQVANINAVTGEERASLKKELEGLYSKGIPVKAVYIDENTNGVTVVFEDGSAYSKDTNTKVNGDNRDFMYQSSTRDKLIQKASDKINEYQYLNQTQKDNAIAKIKATKDIKDDEAFYAALKEAEETAQTLDDTMGILHGLVGKAEDVNNSRAYNDEDLFDQGDLYDAAIEAGRELMNNNSDFNDADKAKVEEFINAIKEAEKNLYIAELDKYLDKAKEIKKTDAYTNDSQADRLALEKAIGAGNGIKEVQNPSSSEIEAATDAVIEALGKIDGKVDKSELAKAIKEANAAKEKDQYKKATDDTKTPFDEALAEAERVNGLDNPTNKEVSDAKAALETALKNLDGKADKGDLEKAIKDAKTAKETDKYKNATDTPKENFIKALAEAERVNGLENPTQAEVDAAKKALDEAKEALDGTVKTDALQKAVDKAEPVKATDAYKNAGEDEKKAYDDALKAAKEALAPNGTDGKTQADIDKLVNDLNNAVSALNGEAQKGDLQTAINSIEGKKKDPTYLNEKDEAKKLALEKALGKAEAVNADPNATQEQVDTAKDELEKARDAINGQADKTELETSIKKAGETSVNEKVSGEDKAKLEKDLKDALEKAKEVDGKENPLQTDVDAAKEALDKAIKAIEDANKKAEDAKTEEDKAKEEAAKQAAKDELIKALKEAEDVKKTDAYTNDSAADKLALEKAIGDCVIIVTGCNNVDTTRLLEIFTKNKTSCIA